MRGGGGKQRADAIEAVPPWVFVERAGCFDIEHHAEKIVDRVGVFLPAETVVFHQSATCHASCRSLANLRRQSVDDVADLCRARLPLLLRRHFGRVDAKYHLAPLLRNLRIREVRRESVESKLSLLRLAAVTTETVGLEEKLQCPVRAVLGVHFAGRESYREQEDDGEREGRRRALEHAHGRTIFFERSRASGVDSHSSCESKTYVHGPLTRMIRPGRNPSSICLTVMRI